MSRAAMPGDLRAFALFEGLAPQTLAALAAESRIRPVAARETLFRQGDEARSLFGVVSGGVRLVRLLPDGRERVLQRVGPGRTFAEAAALSMPRYPATAAGAAGGAEVLDVPAASIRRLLERDPDAAKAIISGLAARLALLVGRVEELTTLSAEARVARHLLDLPSRIVPEGLSVQLPLPKKELAAQLAITPETLSRVLRRWRDSGLLTVTGAEITILDVDALAAAADA